MANLKFKIMNSVTLRFRNSEICSQNYVTIYQRKYFWINNLYKKVLVKSPHSHNCYINMLIDLNNCRQRVEQKRLNTFHAYEFFSHSKMQLSNVYFNYVQMGQN